MTWFRFYTDTIYDRKIRRLSFPHRWLWVTVLSLAKESPIQGKLLIVEGEPMTVEDIQDAANVPLREVAEGIKIFTRYGWLTRCGNGVYTVVNWDAYISSDQERQRPDVWATTRGRIFERDDFTCQYCGARGVRLERDHIVPISRGGSNDDPNLTTACMQCNRSKGYKTLEHWRQNGEGET